ncbi:hypothetical protein OPV22_001855 [Ensete ventricosum]|uniref:Uncharacterized protein n=1 Tax=Ensete ventricosum TaxID=4639 RepID=A0AAV8RSZ9_ENSVE|nr:hypothetical protein OPV22_001855 [Ensete ventricosum]
MLPREKDRAGSCRGLDCRKRSATSVVRFRGEAGMSLACCLLPAAPPHMSILDHKEGLTLAFCDDEMSILWI